MGMCDKEFGHTYGFIVFVSSVLLTIAGGADIVVACNIADECTYSSGLIPLVLMAVGVVSLMTGLLLMYVLGTAMDYGGPFFSNLHWTSYRIAMWAMTIITYLFGLVCCVILELVTRGVQDEGCTGLRGYVIFRLFATSAVPISPVVLVIIIIAIIIALICLACVLAILGGKDDD